MLPASLMTRWNSLFLHTLTHGQGWVGGGGDDDVSFTCTHVTCYALDVSCTCTHVTCYASDLGGWGGDDDVSMHLHTCRHATQRFLHCTHVQLCTCFLHLHRWVGWVGQFTKWHSKTRLTGTQALDKVWSHLKKHVPKSLCSRSKSDRRFNPRMEQYVYSYMWRFNNRNWWKQLGQLCQQHWQKENTSANEVFFFFFSVLPTSQSKIAKIELRTQFWRVFYTSVKIQNRKKRGN